MTTAFFSLPKEDLNYLSVVQQINGLEADILNFQAELKLTNRYAEPEKWKRLEDAISNRQTQINFIKGAITQNTSFGTPLKSDKNYVALIILVVIVLIFLTKR